VGEADMPAVHGARVSARLGDVDMPALLAFFSALLARRWGPARRRALWALRAGCCAAGGPGGTQPQTRPFPRLCRYQPHSGQGMSVPRMLAQASQQDEECSDYRVGGSQRLDDDWA
jgi:hypothetical protein